MKQFRHFLSAAGLATALLVSAPFAMSTTAQAQTQEVSPEQLVLAEKYVYSSTLGYFEQGLLQVSIRAFRAFAKTNPDIGELLQNTVVEVMQSYKDKETQLTRQVALVYAVRFTSEELQQLIDFYETDLGKKVLATSEVIKKDTKSAIDTWSANLSREFVAKLRAEMRTKGHDI